MRGEVGREQDLYYCAVCKIFVDSSGVRDIASTQLYLARF